MSRYQHGKSSENNVVDVGLGMLVFVAMALAVCILSSLSSCKATDILSPTGPTIRVDAIEPLIDRVLDRHDELVTGELDQNTITELQRSIWLDSTEQVRAVFAAARGQAGAGADGVTDGPTSGSGSAASGQGIDGSSPLPPEPLVDHPGH